MAFEQSFLQFLLQGSGQHEALKRALVAAGQLGLTEKPIQPVGKFDPRRMLPSHAYNPDVQGMLDKGGSIVPGPDGTSIGGMPEGGTPSGIAPGANPLGTYTSLEPIGGDDMGSLLQQAQLQNAQMRPMQAAQNFAQRYANDVVGQYGALSNPDAYNDAYMRGLQVHQAKMNLSQIAQIGGTSKQNTEGQVPVSNLPSQEIIQDDAQFLIDKPDEVALQLIGEWRTQDPEYAQAVEAAWLELKRATRVQSLKIPGIGAGAAGLESAIQGRVGGAEADFWDTPEGQAIRRIEGRMGPNIRGFF